MIPAKDCQNMAEIRAEIDDLDKQIIQLIGQRFEYVKAASKFKTSEMAVKAPERFKSMMITRRDWAVENGLSPDIIEKLYTDLVQYFIGEEMKHWKNN